MMQSVLEHFGVAVGAISGGLAARGKHIDLFGVIVLALVTALQALRITGGDPAYQKLYKEFKTKVREVFDQSARGGMKHGQRK